MKLKKLLPLASIAGVAAVVAPLVTSCGTKTYSYTFDSAHLPEDFKPDTQIAETEKKELSELDATKDFLDDVNNNKKILFNELTWGVLDAKIVSTKIKNGLSQATIGKIDSKTGKCTFDFKFDMEFDDEKLDSRAMGNQDLHLAFKVKNLDFIVLYNGLKDVKTTDNAAINPWCFEPTVCSIWNASYWESYYEYLEEYPGQTEAAEIYASNVASQFAKWYLRSHTDWEITYTVSSGNKELPYDVDLVFNSKSSEALIDLLTSPYSYDNPDQSGVMWFLCYDNLFYYQYVSLHEDSNK